MKRIKPKDVLRAALNRFAMIIKKNYKRRRGYSGEKIESR